MRKFLPLIVVGALALGGLALMPPAEESVPSKEAFDTKEALAALSISVPIPAPPERPTNAAFVHAEDKVVANGASSRVDCDGARSSEFYCYEELYADVIKREGIPGAFADLKARFERNPYVRSQCHPLTHVIGRIAAQSFDTVAEAYTHGDGFCWSGYYHGVLETFLGDIGLENLPKHIDGICKELNEDGKYNFNYYNCVHGLGHGVMAVTETELFQSLDHCKKMTGWWEQQSCASGAYMENVIVDGLNHTTKYLDPERPLYPCDESPEEFKNTCYLMQTSYMLKINGGDFVKTFEWCEDAGEYAPTCYQSIGRDASGRTTSDPLLTYSTCMLGGSDLKVRNCMVGSVKDFISYLHSDVRAKEYCAYYTDGLNSLCLDTVRSYYSSF